MKMDPSWIFFAIIIIVVLIFWRPIIGFFHKEAGVLTGSEDIAKGKALFYDIDAWGRHNASCAMCHAKDYTSDKNAQIPFKITYIALKDVAGNYGATFTGTDDRLVDQINKCLSLESRLSVGSLQTQNEKLKLLVSYVKSF